MQERLVSPQAQGADPAASSLGHTPDGKWEFDANVADCFSDMLSRSIPRYEDMRALTLAVGSEYVQPAHHIVDLGCSNGLSLQPFVDRFGAANRFLGLDVSGPMLEAARERFKNFIDVGVVDVRSHDLRKGVPATSACLILSVLTLQFTPIDYRHDILRAAYKALAPGGALVLVEKLLGESAQSNAVLRKVYKEHKLQSGYSEDEVDRKAASLEGVLVPVTERMNVEFLRAAGFREIECYWRWSNFAAFIACK